MGQTLENGVYLPSEGERNCYAGLKTNWEILDQKVADVIALQQAVSGALHREIVESLPTTDINPNTIYMILSGTSATENVYNEFMYVNNAWELIGTSATDLTNYYTKAEVDGKLLLKASASDLTSHTGDTTIHVTASDKNKWNNQTYVFRYSSTALVASSTNSNTLLDNTDNLKVGDKVIDSNGVLFSITAIDTVNSTFTIGTALVDLAQDSDVVHKSGNETISGVKTITGTSLEFKSTSAEYGVSAGDSSVIFRDKNNLQTFKIYSRVFYSGIDNNLVSFFLTQKVDNTYYTSNGIQLFANTDNKNATLRPILANNNADGLSVSLGDSNRRWQSVYANNYYYGSNNVEFSTKFVTTDTNQTISGAKTFSDNLTIYNSDDTQTPKGLIIRNAQWVMGESGGVTTSSINFLDKNSAIPASIIASKGISGQSFLRFSVRTKDSQNNALGEEIYYDIDTSGNVEFRSWHDNIISLGTSAYKWKDVNTKLINSVEPSSLSLPSGNVSDVIDISSYFSNTGTGDTNSYTASANGWIYLRLGDITSCQVVLNDSNNRRLWGTSATGNVEQIIVPILKNTILTTTWVTNSTVNVATARFIPCQGNV